MQEESDWLDQTNCVKLHETKLLPTDIENHIFDWMGCEELAILSRVSKTQDETVARYLSQTQVIQLARSYRYLHEFWMGSYSLDLVLKNCKNLKRIYFEAADGLLQKIIIPKMKLDSATRLKMERWIERLIFQNSKTLEVISGNLENWISPMAIVELSECKNLKTLIERTDRTYPETVPEKFCISAMELALTQCQNLQVFETTAISFVKTCELLEKAPCLEQLTSLALPNLTLNEAKTQAASKFFNVHLPGMKNLTDLTMSVELANKRMWKSFHATIQVIAHQLHEFTLNNIALQLTTPWDVSETYEWVFPNMKEIQFADHEMDTQKLEYFPNIVAPKLTKLWAKINSKNAKKLAKNCPMLERIIISDPEMNWSENIQICELQPLPLVLLETSCPVMDIQNLSCFSDIQHINLSVDRKSFSLVSFLIGISNCRHLNNIKIFACASLDIDRPVEDWGEVKKVTCPSIFSIHVSECSDEFLNHLECLNLVNFELQGRGCNGVKQLDKFLVKCPKLEAFDIIESKASFERTLLPRMKYLTHLTFHDCVSLTTLDVRDFLSVCPEIITLRISKCPLVTEMILMFITRLTNLCTLEIADLDPILPVKRLFTIFSDIANQNPMLKYILTNMDMMTFFEHPPGVSVDRISDIYATTSDCMSIVSSDEEDTDVEQDQDQDQDENQDQDQNEDDENDIDMEEGEDADGDDDDNDN